jgi:lysophospholipase L1-like esterase
MFWLLLLILSSEPVLVRCISPDNSITPASRALIWAMSLVFAVLAGISYMGRSRRFVALLNVTLVTLAACGLVMEGYLRWLEPDPVREGVQIFTVRQPDAYLHHTLRPNSHAMLYGRNRRERTAYYVNSLGYRDGSCRVVRHRTDAQARVLVLGDSFTEGLGVDNAATFASSLESRFAAAGRRVEVLNGGVMSYFPELYYRKLMQFLNSGYVTDVVVVMMDITDVNDASRNYGPWGGFSPEELRQEEVGSYARIGRAAVSYYEDWEWKTAYPRALRVLRNLPELVRTARDDPWKNVLKEWDLGPTTPHAGAGQWTEDKYFHEDWVQVGIKRCQEQIIKIRDVCGTNGLRMALAIYPHPAQLNSPRRPSRQQEIFGEWCRAQHIVLFDLYPGFQRQKSWREFFLRGDTHWNERGHGLIAELLYEHLAERQWP